jgi:hypothetical protein
MGQQKKQIGVDWMIGAFLVGAGYWLAPTVVEWAQGFGKL